jgi:hypothetical protein
LHTWLPESQLLFFPFSWSLFFHFISIRTAG